MVQSCHHQGSHLCRYDFGYLGEFQVQVLGLSIFSSFWDLVEFQVVSRYDIGYLGEFQVQVLGLSIFLSFWDLVEFQVVCYDART